MRAGKTLGIICLAVGWKASLVSAQTPGANAPLLGAAGPPPVNLLPAKSAPAISTMGVAEIKPGMKGEWRTVVQGTAVQSFALEVLGVMENFSGPKRAIIICQALDQGQMLNGPVQGMSGSPVYIEGKLVGAYAYGFSYSKDQAIIGVTPIADMLEVLDAPAMSPLPGRPAPPRWRALNDAPKTAAAGLDDTSRPAAAAMAGMPGREDWRVTRGSDRLSGLNVASVMHPVPVPVPLTVSGVSARTLAAFKDEFARRGISVVQAPGGTASGGGPDASKLEPGSAMAVVLMSGDFSLSGVGTLTWRQGDKLLAFGHPMFNFGAVDMPLATAEVVTIVRAVDQSFKLANIGPVVGTISQDRLTGVGGAIGQKPVMAAFRARVTAPDGSIRTFQGDMWRNREYTPMIGGVGLLESLNSTLQTVQEQTFYVDMVLDLEGFEPVKLHQVASGADGAQVVANEFMRELDQLFGNPFEMPRMKSVDFDIKLRDAWLMSSIEAVRVDSGPALPGEKLRVTLSLANYLDAPTEKTLEIPIPATAAGETLTLFLGDAASADTLDRGATRRDLASLADIVNYLRQGRSRGALYVKLLRNSPGLRVEGASLPGLPPSVEALYLSPKNVTPTSVIGQTTIWEATIPVPGEYTGRYTMPVEVRR